MRNAITDTETMSCVVLGGTNGATASVTTSLVNALRAHLGLVGLGIAGLCVPIDREREREREGARGAHHRGPRPVILKRPPGGNNNSPEASGISWQPSITNPGRQVLCPRLRFSRVVWAVWVGASWDGAPALGHWEGPRCGRGARAAHRHPQRSRDENPGMTRPTFAVGSLP